MNLPPHRKTVCVGIDIYGVKEDCGQPVERDSIFPYCERHRLMLQKMPRRRTCAGAISFDHVMKPVQMSCGNLTGHEDERLCASCRVIEARERERAKAAFHDRCPSCGNAVKRPQVHQRPEPVTEPQRRRPSYRPPESTRRPSEPARATFLGQSPSHQTRSYGQGVPRYVPPTNDED